MRCLQLGGWLGVGLVLLVATWLFTPSAAAREQLQATIELDGREASRIDIDEPLVLEADEPLEVRVGAVNPGSQQLLIRSVRLESTVMGLTFLAYETQVNFRVPASGSGDLTFGLDLLDLHSQATGLLPAEVELLDADREPITAVPLTVDVQGSLTSVYGTFGLAVLALTVLALALALIRLGWGWLPANRWARALQFAAPGLGIGLVLTIGLSTLRIFSPAAGSWGTLMVACGAIGFAIGYLTPTPEAVDPADVDAIVASGDTGEEDTAERGGGSAEDSPARGASQSTLPGQRPPSEPGR